MPYLCPQYVFHCCFLASFSQCPTFLLSTHKDTKCTDSHRPLIFTPSYISAALLYSNESVSRKLALYATWWKHRVLHRSSFLLDSSIFMSHSCRKWTENVISDKNRMIYQSVYNTGKASTLKTFCVLQVSSPPPSAQQVRTQQASSAADQSATMAKLFSAYDVCETSHHLQITHLDLHICDDIHAKDKGNACAALRVYFIKHTNDKHDCIQLEVSCFLLLVYSRQ